MVSIDTVLLQVSSGNTDAAQWLHQASAALPGLRYLALPNLQQAVASLLDVICCTPALCNPLSGTHDTAAEFGQALLGSSISHVRAAACKALAGAVCVGSAAARSCAAAMVCHQTMLRSLVCTALAEEDSQQHAAQALQVPNNTARAMPHLLYPCEAMHDRACLQAH